MDTIALPPNLLSPLVRLTLPIHLVNHSTRITTNHSHEVFTHSGNKSQIATMDIIALLGEAHLRFSLRPGAEKIR